MVVMMGKHNTTGGRTVAAVFGDDAGAH